MIAGARFRFGRGRRYPLICLVSALATISGGLAEPARGQSFVITGGSSTISRAHGVSVQLRTAKSIGRFDIGALGGTSIGFFRRQTYHGMQVDVGDQAVLFGVPTDSVEGAFYFLGRGISTQRKDGASRLAVFAGAASTGLQAPFLRVAHSRSPAGALLYERKVTPSVRLVSRNLVSRRITTLQSVEWQARKDLKLAATGGLGSGQSYWASAVRFDQGWLAVDAGYVRSGDRFRRLMLESPQFAESDRERVRLTFAPTEHFRFVVTRDNYLSPPVSGLPSRAAVDGAGFWTSIARTQFNGSVFRSTTSAYRSQALALGVRRAIAPRVESGLEYLSQGRLFSKRGMFLATLRETLSSRIAVSQVISRSGPQTSVAFGGRFLSNLVTVTADYQSVFLPFAPAGTSQVRQVLQLGVHLQLPHGVQLQADTDLDPAGKIRYTGYGTSYSYRAMTVAAGASASGGFLRYLVQGRIVDVDGQPVEGAAVRIGKDLAFTNSRGAFSLRVRRADTVAFAVALDEFVAPGRYEVLSSPQSVKPAPDDEAPTHEIVVRRLPNAAVDNAPANP